MKAKEQFQKHYPKILLEAILKSALWGMSVGFALCFIAALISWFTPYNGLIIAVCVFLGATVITSTLLYFVKFKPSVVKSAKRLDSMGLEERMVTMVEFKDDESTMARVQREDAIRTLGQLDKKQLRVKLTKKLIATLTVFAILGCSMTVVSALSYKGLLPKGAELVDNMLPEEMAVYVSVTYLVEEGGTIEGETDQLVLEGDSALPVIAKASDGFVFVGWDDGEIDPSRLDRNVVKDIVVMAIFEPIEGEEGEDDDGGDKGDQGGEDKSSEMSDENSNSSNDENEEQPEAPQESDSNDKAGGGKYEDHNQIIDGQTYYREYLETYRAEIEKYLKEHGDELTEEQKAIILAYIGIV